MSLIRWRYKLIFARAILNDRLFFKILFDHAVSMMFVVQKRLNKFAKIILPDESKLKAQVDNMSTAKIGSNYEYKK